MDIAFLDLKKINGLFEPQLSEAVAATVASGRYLHGERCAEFERRFADYCGSRHCVGVGNGLDALTLILTAMKTLHRWEDGDEVVVPAFTFVATAEAVVRSGLRPVFCDIRPDDFLLHAADVEPLITPRTRAVLPVHLYGKVCDMNAFHHLADRHGLKIVEDAAQAHGADFAGRRAGSWGDAAAFSFYPGKNLGALGDGGAVTTDDLTLATLVRTLANYGAERKYHHTYMGINSRLDEIQAAALSVKLTKLDDHNRRRREAARFYREHITNPLVSLPYGGETETSVFHIYPLLTDHREKLQDFLSSRGVTTLIHYPLAVHRQQAFGPYNRLAFPNAEQTARRELSLPLSPVLTEDELHYVTETINLFNL